MGTGEPTQRRWGSKQGSKLGQALPLKVGGGCFAALLGAYGAAATLGKTANVFEIVSGLSTGWFTLLLFLIVIALDNWTINVLNLYTGGLSLSNIFEQLGRFWTTVQQLANGRSPHGVLSRTDGTIDLFFRDGRLGAALGLKPAQLRRDCGVIVDDRHLVLAVYRRLVLRRRTAIKRGLMRGR